MVALQLRAVECNDSPITNINIYSVDLSAGISNLVFLAHPFRHPFHSDPAVVIFNEETALDKISVYHTITIVVTPRYRRTTYLHFRLYKRACIFIIFIRDIRISRHVFARQYRHIKKIYIYTWRQWRDRQCVRFSIKLSNESGHMRIDDTVQRRRRAPSRDA